LNVLINLVAEKRGPRQTRFASSIKASERNSESEGPSFSTNQQRGKKLPNELTNMSKQNLPKQRFLNPGMK
jgi:hypothetical protein